MLKGKTLIEYLIHQQESSGKKRVLEGKKI